MYEYARQTPLALALERALECRLLADYVLERPILDIGCGDGRFAEILYGNEAGIEYGLDLDPKETARARARNVYRTVITGSATKIPLGDASVATVISNSTLEHIPELAEVLRESARVIRSGGHLLITVPTDRFDRYSVIYRVLHTIGLRGAAERFRAFYDRFWHHYHFYQPAKWKELVERAGFRVVETVEYDSALRCAIHDALVPLAFPTLITKQLLGRYALVPPLRAVLIRVIRRLLPADRTARVKPGTGGLVFLRAERT